jgi:hypothetical protein
VPAKQVQVPKFKSQYHAKKKKKKKGQVLVLGVLPLRSYHEETAKFQSWDEGESLQFKVMTANYTGNSISF